MTRKLFYGLVIIFILLALGLKFYKLLTEVTGWDDSYYLNVATNYERNGLLTPLMWRYDADTNIIAGSGTGYGILLPIFWYKVFGASLLTGRILSYLVALLILPVVYLTSRLWWGHLAGIVAVVFTVLNPMFTSNFSLRMDAFGQLAYSLVLLLHIYAVRSQRHYLHFAVGVAAIISAEFHILGVLYLFGLALYHSVEQIQTFVSARRFQLNLASVYYMAGALVAGLIYLVVHVLPDPQAYFMISKVCRLCEGQFFRTELIRIYEFFYVAPIASFIFILALYTLARHLPQTRHYLLLTFGIFLMLIVINPPAQFQYLAHLLPLWSIGVAGFFYHHVKTLDMLNQKHIVTLGILGILMLLPVHFALYSNIGTRNELEQVSPEVIDYIYENIPEDAVIIGPTFAYVELIPYYNFMSFGDGEMLGLEFRGESVESYLERQAPQVIITRPYPNPHLRAEAFEILAAYVQEHGFVEVIPDLLVLPELIND